jgi:hypothetical protein
VKCTSGDTFVNNTGAASIDETKSDIQVVRKGEMSRLIVRYAERSGKRSSAGALAEMAALTVCMVRFLGVPEVVSSECVAVVGEKTRASSALGKRTAELAA